MLLRRADPFARSSSNRVESCKDPCSIENFEFRVEPRGVLNRVRKFRVLSRKSLFDARSMLDSIDSKAISVVGLLESIVYMDMRGTGVSMSICGIALHVGGFGGGFLWLVQSDCVFGSQLSSKPSFLDLM